MNAKRLFASLLILVLSLATAACGIVSYSTEGGELTLSVNMSESQVNRLISSVFTRNDGDNFLFTEISSVDLIEPNVIRLAGTTADGATGTYDMTIDVIDEVIKLEVVAVDVPGVTMDDPRVQAANDELEQAFLDSAGDNAGSDGEPGGVTDVVVAGDELTFTIKAPLN